MAVKKVSELPQDSSPTSDDYLLAVDNATSSSKKVTMRDAVSTTPTTYISEGTNLYYTDERVRFNRLDQMSPPSANVDFSGNGITNLADPINPQDAVTKIYADALGGGGGGSGIATEFTVSQSSHGFVVGDIIRNSGTANTYTKAQADSAVHAEVVGIVSQVITANSFKAIVEGIVTDGVPAAIAGTVMFLDPSTAGALTNTEPTSVGQISKPLAIILESSVRMLFTNYRGELLTSTTGGGGGGSPLTIQDIDGSPSVANVTTIRVTNGTMTDDGSGQVTIDTGAGGGGSGDVVGPSSATDNALARFDSTTGKLIQGSDIVVDNSNNISGLGTVSSGAITSTGASSLGSLSLSTDLSVIDGGTGSSTATGARTNLGVTKVVTTVGSSDADYITDGTGDDIQIQAALDYIGGIGGGTVLVKAGLYDITAALSVWANTVFEGEGIEITKFRQANATNLFRCIKNKNYSSSADDNIEMRDFSFDGNGSNQSSTSLAINFQLGDNIRLSNIYIHGCRDEGIYLTSMTHISLRGVKSTANGRDGVVLSSCNSGLAIDCDFSNNGTGGSRSGLYIAATANFKVSNCQSDNNPYHGFDISGTGSTYVIISSSSAASNGRYGVYCGKDFANPGVGPQHCIIENNHLSLNQFGGIGTELNSYVVIKGNVLVQNAYGMYLDGSNYQTVVGNIVYLTDKDGINLHGSSFNTVEGNTVVNSSQLTNNTYIDIILTERVVSGQTTLKSTYNTVSGNTCVATATNKVGAGIKTGTSTDNFNNFSNNIAYGMAIRTAINTFHNSVFNNGNLNPEGYYSVGNQTGSYSFDRTNGSVQDITLTGNITFSLANAQQIGDKITLIIRQDSSGGRIVTWPATAELAQGGIVLSTGANAIDVVTLVYRATAKWTEEGRALQTGAMVQDATSSVKGIVTLTNDLGGTATAPTVTATHLSSALPVNQGGTGVITLTGVLKGNGTSALTDSATLTDLSSPSADFSMNSHKLVSLTDPTSAQDAATKAYVDSVAQGLNTKQSCRAATTTALAAHTRSGNILTASVNGTIAAQDGVSLVLNDRLLVKNEGSGTHLENGIYYVSAVGDGSNPWTLTRTTDADTDAEVTNGMFTFMSTGTTQSSTGWVLTTSNPITLNTTALTFSQFSAASNIVGGDGLVLTGSILDIVGTSNRITANANSIDISSSYVGQASITTLGTITTGTWNASTLGVPYGGTGVATLTANGILQGNGTSTISAVSPGVSGTVLVSNGTTASFNTITNNSLTSGSFSNITGVGTLTSGTLGSGFTTILPAQGGTGVTTFGGTNRLLYTTSTDTLSSLATANDSILITNSGGVPSLSTDIPSAVTQAGQVIYRVNGTDVAIGDGGTGQSTKTAAFDALSPNTTQGDIIYHDGTNNVRLAKGTANQVLAMNGGATAPSWITNVAAYRTLITLGSDVNSAASTSFQNVTGLSFSVTSGVNYRFYALIFYIASVATIGLRVSVTTPTTTWLAYTTRTPLTSTGSASNDWVNGQVSSDTGTTSTSSVSNSGNILILEGIIKPSVSGTLQVRFAPETATASGITIKAGSTLEWW